MTPHRPLPGLAVAAAALAVACAQPEPEMPMDDAATVTEANPFFADSPLPFHYPPFDRIDDSLYRPAFERGMAEQLAEVEAIADAAEAPRLDNTLVALERSGRVLERVSQVFFNLTSADTNDTLDAIRSEMAPKLSAHSDRILLNGALFERVRALYEQARRAGPGRRVTAAGRGVLHRLRAGRRAAPRSRAAAPARHQRGAGGTGDDIQPERVERGERIRRGRGDSRGAGGTLRERNCRRRRRCSRPGPRRPVPDRAAEYEWPAAACVAPEPGAAPPAHGNIAGARQPGRRVRQPRRRLADRAAARGAGRPSRVPQSRRVQPGAPDRAHGRGGQRTPGQPGARGGGERAPGSGRPAGDSRGRRPRPRGGGLGLGLLHRAGAGGAVRLRRIGAAAVLRDRQRTPERCVPRGEPAVRADLPGTHGPAGLPPGRAGVRCHRRRRRAARAVPGRLLRPAIQARRRVDELLRVAVGPARHETGGRQLPERSEAARRGADAA